MPRPVKFPELVGLSGETHRFYAQRALEGVYPTELALKVIRNEEARYRAGQLRVAASHKAKPAVGKVPLAAKQRAMKAKQPAVPVKQPVYAWTEPPRPPVPPMRITREEAMARKAW